MGDTQPQVVNLAQSAAIPPGFVLAWDRAGAAAARSAARTRRA